MWVKIYISLSGRIPTLQVCWMESGKEWRQYYECVEWKVSRSEGDLKNQSLVFCVDEFSCWLVAFVDTEGGKKKKVRVTPFVSLRSQPSFTSKSCHNCNREWRLSAPEHLRWIGGMNRRDESERWIGESHKLRCEGRHSLDQVISSSILQVSCPLEPSHPMVDRDWIHSLHRCSCHDGKSGQVQRQGIISWSS